MTTISASRDRIAQHSCLSRLVLTHFEVCVTRLFFLGVLLSLSLSIIHDAYGSPPGRYKVVPVTDGGTLRGSVILRGNPPANGNMEITKDSKVCGLLTASPRLSLGEANGVKNAIISLEDIQQGKKFPDVEPVLDQQGCVYDPHILIVPSGSLLEITNSDPILHNVHVYDLEDGGKTMFNIAQPLKGQKTPIKPTLFKHDGLFLATCDAGHPWMSAYILVAGHPYCTASDGEGKFVLGQIPPGKYSLHMWHEGIKVTKRVMENGRVKSYSFEEPYESRQQVLVRANEDTTVNFELILR